MILTSVGSIGLIKAVDSFKPDKGARLATYAARCIENEMLSPSIKGAFHDAFAKTVPKKDLKHIITIESIATLPHLDSESSIGTQIKYYRLLRGLSQEELGQATGATKYGIEKVAH